MNRIYERQGEKMKKIVIILILSIFIVVLSACADTPQETLAPLPPPESDGGPFGVDANINIHTIDDFLNRPDVAYFDVRMFYDPADYEAIGGISRITKTLPGYRIVPLPYIASLSALPVEGAYDGPRLFEVEWGETRGEVLNIKANFRESDLILSEIFPKDKPIFLMCGGAGYTSLLRGLLIHKGYDSNLIYHTGGMWHYEGTKALDLTIPGEDFYIATWRVNYTLIDFNHLNAINP